MYEFLYDFLLAIDEKCGISVEELLINRVEIGDENL
jgi:hypothetical protein